MAPLFTGSDARPRMNRCSEPAVYKDSFEPIRKSFVKHSAVNNGYFAQNLNICHHLLTLINLFSLITNE